MLLRSLSPSFCPDAKKLSTSARFSLAGPAHRLLRDPPAVHSASDARVCGVLSCQGYIKLFGLDAVYNLSDGQTVRALSGPCLLLPFGPSARSLAEGATQIPRSTLLWQTT